MAKSVAAEVAGDGNMDRHEARRLAARLAGLPDERTFLSLVRRRADIRSYWADPGVLAELANDACLSLGGPTALAVLAGLAEGTAPLLAYVDAAEGERLVAQYRAVAEPAGNLQLAMILPEVPVAFRPEPGKLTSASVTFTDALASDDARARRLASDWFRGVRRSLEASQPN